MPKVMVRRLSSMVQPGAPTAGAPSSSWQKTASNTPGWTSSKTLSRDGQVERLNQGRRVVPTIVFTDGVVLTEPSNEELAAKLGLITTAKHSFYDLIIIGGGPAGLTAAIYSRGRGCTP